MRGAEAIERAGLAVAAREEDDVGPLGRGQPVGDHVGDLFSELGPAHRLGDGLVQLGGHLGGGQGQDG